MDGIFAETYLRRCAEDALRSSFDGEAHALFERLRALLFTALVPSDVASAIWNSYRRARRLRELGDFFGEDDDDRTVVTTTSVRVARCSGEVTTSTATIVPRLVVLGSDRTRVAVTVRFTSVPRRGGARPYRHGFMELDEIALRDDRGRSVTAHLSGGGGGGEWRGWYEAEPGLSPDTRWIEVEGTRLRIDNHEVAATAIVENFSDDDDVGDRAARYLEHLHDSGAADPDRALLAAADALIACGALPADAPAAARARGADPGPAPHPALFPGPGHAHFRTVATSGGARPGASENVIVGVTTPAVDGAVITVIDLEYTPHGFQITIDGHGRIAIGHGPHVRLETPRLSMSALDDRGNTYRGSIAEFGHGSEGFSGTVEFFPALDPRAAAVDLEFRTERARAVVHVPLALNGRP